MTILEPIEKEQFFLFLGLCAHNLWPRVCEGYNGFTEFSGRPALWYIIYIYASPICPSCEWVNVLEYCLKKVVRANRLKTRPISTPRTVLNVSSESNAINLIQTRGELKRENKNIFIKYTLLLTTATKKKKRNSNAIKFCLPQRKKEKSIRCWISSSRSFFLFFIIPTPVVERVTLWARGESYCCSRRRLI
jgi:hypothetical protein